MSKIGPFSLYTKTPNDIRFGKLYTLDVELPIPYSPKRIVRVYLPEDFDENKKYPLLVMADGQNIVDKYTTAFGAWDIDVHEHNLIEKGLKSFIVLGIDSPKDPLHRALEYSFPFIRGQKGGDGDALYKTRLKFESHLLNKYIAEELVPLVRKYFPISDRKEDIGAGGASMGGIFALTLPAAYPETFGFSLIFSPGFFLYSLNEIKKYLDGVIPGLRNNKLFFYSGNVGFESKFLESTKSIYKYFIDNGFDEKHVTIILDLKAEHNEACWSKHFEEAIEFWQKNLL